MKKVRILFFIFGSFADKSCDLGDMRKYGLCIADWGGYIGGLNQMIDGHWAESTSHNEHLGIDNFWV